MYKATVIIALAMLFSCQKEVSTKSLTASTQSQLVEHQTTFIPFDTQGADDWFDPCTNERVHLTGGISVEYTNVIVGNKINSEITFHYNSLSGTGDLSGMKYQGMGALKTNSQSVWNDDLGYYETKNSNTHQKIMLTVPGANNNMVFDVSFKIVYDANHNLKVETESFVYNSCQ
jgi:hypothetical protein